MDAFLIEALRRFPGGKDSEENMKQTGRSRAAVYTDWLSEQLGHAATLDEGATSLIRFTRHRISRGVRAPEGPDVTLHGVLVIRDPSTFSTLLAGGIGRHKAYGYGMLLLRPPSQPAPGR